VFATIANVFKAADLRNKILFTLAMIVLYRLGAQLPAPGVDLDEVVRLQDQSEEAGGGIFNYLDLFSGGALSSLSLFALGIMPYITASIIMQILTVAIPKLEEWQSQGAVGQRKITQWTRYVGILIALIQGTGLVFLIHNNPEGFFGVPVALFPDFGPGRVILVITCLTTGAALLMWIGELMTQRGIGNGMSLLIFSSVVASLPRMFQTLNQVASAAVMVGAVIGFVVLAAGIVFVEQGQRRIPVSFAKRVVGRKMYGGNNTYIPLKVNQAGVIPVIFASSLLQLPQLLVGLLPAEGWGQDVRNFISDNLYRSDSIGYVLGFGILIVGFAYFYNAIAFDPVKRADELRKSGGFIPGIRPGPQTERHLAKILNRITLPGALFLAVVALIPSFFLARAIGGDGAGLAAGFSGVSLLIAVGVALETMKQIDSQLMMRNYEGFLK
jgi:preprotein translocase subunit SecY